MQYIHEIFMNVQLSVLCRRLAVAGLVTLSASAAYAQTSLSMWYHGAGNKAEKDILASIIKDFRLQRAWPS